MRLCIAFFLVVVPNLVSAQCPQPTISGLQILCSGQPITLTASGGYAGYSWSNGANTQSTTVNTPGPYVVTVTCSNGNTAVAFVNVQGFNTGVAPAAIPPGVNICVGQCSNINVLVNNGGNTGPFTLTLDRSTGGQEVITFNCVCQIFTFSLCPTETTTYTFVSLVNSQGCADFVNPALTSFTITVLNNPLVVNGPASLCPGQTGTLTATPNNGNNYTWSNGASGSSITVNGPGTYSVTATFNGGCTSTGSITVAGENLPSPTVSGPSGLCPGETIELSATGGYATYEWSNGQNTQTISVNTAGSYAVTVTSPSGCTASASATVVAQIAPSVSFSAQNDCSSGCQMIDATFTGTAPYTLTYQVTAGATQQTFTQTFGNSNASFEVCPPPGFSGSMEVSAVGLTDAFCTCN
jgi:hypothetical protein